MPGYLQPLVGVLALATVGVLACSVGEGTGVARGLMYMESCVGGAARGTREAPREYNLRPRFFAGEPIEDVRDGVRQNRLILRLQRSGGRVEVTDTLYFDLVNLYEVARCLRGRAVVDASGAMRPDYDPTLCYWPTPTGPPRVRIGFRDHARASLEPRASCDQPMTAVAVSCLTDDCANVSPERWESWIEFAAFGAASAAGQAPLERSPVGHDFKVDFGERIRASAFQLTLEDARVRGREDSPATGLVGLIGGTISGWFDFDLERGRAAQTFP